MAQLLLHRLHGSRSTRTTLIGCAVALLGATVALEIWAPDLVAQLGGALVGSALALVFVVGAIKVPEEECAFCRKRRAEVRKLIAGPTASMCDECASLTMSIINEELERAGETAALHRRQLEAMPAHCPTALSRALVQAMVPAEADAATLRAAMQQAFRVGNSALCVELLRRIPEADRLAPDWINLGVSLGLCGQYEDAIAAMERAQEKDDGTWRALCQNHLAFLRCRAKPGASEAERREWLASIRETKRLLAGKESDAQAANTLLACLGLEAELLRSLGERDAALSTLEAAEKMGIAAYEGERSLVRARIFAGAKEPAKARAECEKALVILHPESLAAAEARELLAKLAS